MLTLKIDTRTWKTPSAFAAEKGISSQAVSNRIARKKLKKLEIKEIGLILVAELNADPVILDLV